jgi:isoquinoline 1-oxidoreductase beta subunit
MAAAKPASPAAVAPAGPFEPNAFLRIGADNSVTVMSKHLEMGQGTYTGLATIWPKNSMPTGSRSRRRRAGRCQALQQPTFWGPAQGTGGSTAMANSWDQMRKAGAAGRAMLVSAAAKRWKVGEAEIVVRDGVVSHAASGRKASFGELALDAARRNRADRASS